MPLLAGLVILIQFSFAFHALKTGRPYWWIFIIMAFPVMGCLIYYLVEVFPGSREQRKANKAAARIAQALKPEAELKRRAEELEICGSVDNKMALAEECLRRGMAAEAEKLYESCLDGAFAADRAVLFGLARAAVENGNWSKAEGAIARLRSADPKWRALEVQLLEARTLEGRGDEGPALSLYQELVPVFVGLEARFRYGAFLLKTGQQDSALQVFNDVIRDAKRFPSSLEEEQQWVGAARQAVASQAQRA